ncbi:hypothetical protein EV194_11524 [Natronoflexus pectinivorans]|uniref:Uncharacterized protein n=1 Tax=Natronoflexus pectinivorans TaxID=682526 RepID=A0A4R2GDG4_9BACT|nr:hypothetical protein EV194_11524 [Natronoflexus pectinivorans]
MFGKTSEISPFGRYDKAFVAFLLSINSFFPDAYGCKLKSDIGIAFVAFQKKYVCQLVYVPVNFIQ